MDEYTNWDDLAKELGIDQWRAEHPWLHRRIRFRMWLRKVVWKLTRRDMG